MLEFEPKNKILMHYEGYNKVKCYAHETCGCKLVERWLLGAFQAAATTKLCVKLMPNGSRHGYLTYHMISCHPTIVSSH